MKKQSRIAYAKQLLKNPSDQSKVKYIAFMEERIYGTVTLMAISLGLLVQPGLKASSALGIIISTAFGLWLAGLFASITAYRIGHDKAMPRSEFFHELTVHRGLLIAAVPTVLMLLIAFYELIEVRTALIASLSIAAITMIALIVRSANTARNSFKSTAIIVASQTLIALAVIFIKLGGK